MDIEGVTISKLKIIRDERGSVMHMLRNDSQIFKSFGEIYFSTIYENKIKAWHLHKESYLNYVCVTGKVKLVLFDDRKKAILKINIKKYYCLQMIIFLLPFHLMSGMVLKVWGKKCRSLLIV